MINSAIGEKVGSFQQTFSTFISGAWRVRVFLAFPGANLVTYIIPAPLPPIMLRSCAPAGMVIGFYYGWRLTLVLLGCVPLLAVAGGFSTMLMATRNAMESKLYSHASAISHETFSAMRTVAAFNGEERAKKSYAEARLGDDCAATSLPLRALSRCAELRLAAPLTGHRRLHAARDSTEDDLRLWARPQCAPLPPGRANCTLAGCGRPARHSLRHIRHGAGQARTRLASDLRLTTVHLSPCPPVAATLIMNCVFALCMWYGAVLIRDGEMDGGAVMTTFFAVMMGGSSLGQAAPNLDAFARGKGAGYNVFKARAQQRNPHALFC